MSDSVIVTIGAPDNQTAVSISSADRIFVDIAAGFTGQGGGGEGGDTNLTTTRTATTVTIVSSTGTDATIPAADGTNAGVMTAAMQTKLAGIEDNADVTDATNVAAAGAVMESDYSTAHSVLVQQSGSGSPEAVHLGNNTILGKSGGGNIAALSASTVRSLINVEDGADVTDAANVGSVLNAATAKTTPVDADTIPLSDSAAAGGLKKLSWANLKATAKAYFDTVYAAIVHTHVISDVTNLQTALDGKVDENAAITGATKTKITYDAKGLVTAGADATTADIADSSNKRYVTDAQLTVIGNTSGTNTGDQNLFGKVAVSGQSDVVADSINDTLTLVAGNNITITTDASTDSITIASTGGGGVSDGDKGDITVSSSGTVWTVDNDAITYAKIQNVSDTNRFLGRITSGAGDIEELTGTQATTLLDTFTSSLKGLAPASGGGTTNFLRADGTWAAPAGGGGGGAVTLDATNTQTGPANSTTETAIYSFALPTDLVEGDMVQLNLTGLYKNNSGASRTVYMYWKLGATTLMEHDISLSANAAERIGNMVFTMFVGASNTQKFGLYSFSADSPANDANSIQTGSRFFNSIGYASSSEDLSTSKTLQVTVRFLLANADLYCYSQAARLIKFPAP